MNYDSSVLEQINREVDLYAYANQSFEFKKNGDNYYTNCPLHVDNTPSLCFTPAKNFYYCFSCGKSGGIIRFLMDFEGLSFEKAVEKASKLANVDISKMCHSKTIAFLKSYRKTLLRQKEEYKHKVLSAAVMHKFKKTEIREWIDEGISQKVMNMFGVCIDDFSNRIVYPVYDINGNLINVKGRTRYKNYKEMGLQKYINYYEVGVMDYFQCLDKTLPYVLDKKEIVIFESIKSVMKAYDWGYKNCASAEKHTLTPEQINLLVRLKANVVLAYDTDVDYQKEEKLRQNVNSLRHLTNVYIIEDKHDLLGGAKSKNAPVDCGREVWEELYLSKRKVVQKI